MTKAELIRKITKRSGVPDSEAKIFFEIFLKKASEILSPGEAISIAGIGYFQLRKGKIKHLNGDDSSALIDLLIFSPSKEEDEQLVFNVPSASSEKYNWIDSLFSLSIGKPVIPLRGVKNTEFFIPPSGQEFRRLIETKVDNQISRGEVVSDFSKGNNVLLIDRSTFNPNQIEINWEEAERKIDKSAEAFNIEIIDTDEDEEKIPWDFGSDLSRQLEEESILDVEKDEEEFLEFDENVTWNFGIPGSPITEEELEESNELLDAIEEEKQKIDDAAAESLITEMPVTEELEPEISIEEFEDKQAENIIEESAEEDEPHVDEEKAPPNFERVVSLTKELGADDIDSEWDFGKRTLADTKLYTVENDSSKDEKGYTEVKLKTDTRDFFFNDKLLKDIDEENYEEIELPHVDAEAGEKKEEYKEPDYFKVEEDDDLLEEEYSSFSTKKTGKFAESKSTPAFIVGGSIIMFAVIGWILYQYFTETTSVKETKQIAQASAPVVIERDYEVAVSYPYKKNELNKENGFNAIAPSALEGKEEAADEPAAETVPDGNQIKEEPAAETPAVRKPAETKPEQSKPAEVKSGSASQKISSLISKEGDTYSVQVSSWKDRKIAEGEVRKYSSRGLNSFIEEANIPGRGLWYRVRIGGFKTLSEAQKFSNQK